MERLGLRKAFAFDPHFRQYGFPVVGPSQPLEAGSFTATGEALDASGVSPPRSRDRG